MASKARASARHSHASHAAMTRTTFHPGMHVGASGATHRSIEVENQGRNAERGPKHEPRHHCVHNTQLPLPQHCPLDISIGQQPACKGGTQRHDARPSPQNNSRRDILSNGGEVVAMNQQRCHFGRVAERVPDRIRCTHTHTHTNSGVTGALFRCGISKGTLAERQIDLPYPEIAIIGVVNRFTKPITSSKQNHTDSRHPAARSFFRRPGVADS